MGKIEKEDKNYLEENLDYKIQRYRPLIVGFLVVMLPVLSFYIGVTYSCQGHVLNGFKCVDPEIIELVQVCEYNTYTCAAKCENAMIADKEAFKQLYGE